MLLIALNMLNGYEEKKICFNGKKILVYMSALWWSNMKFKSNF